MSRKNKQGRGGYVYSTDPDFRIEEESTEEQTLIPSEQKLKIRLDTKQRAGKAVTLIDGFVGNAADLQDLGKTLKSFCGSGGSVKEGGILIQGDHREKVVQWLLKNGYKNSKKI